MSYHTNQNLPPVTPLSYLIETHQHSKIRENRGQYQGNSQVSENRNKGTFFRSKDCENWKKEPFLCNPICF